jgi:nucleoside-diphosphate-sugar epimerase
MNVLVTGAAGFIGSRLVAALVSQGHQVTATVSSRQEYLATLSPCLGRLNLIHGDLASELQLPDDLDAVIHAAARSAWPGVTASSIVKSNVLATEKLIRHAKTTGVRRFIFLSSLSVYGQVSSPIVDEATPIINPGVYGLSKRIGEHLLMGEAQCFPSLAIRLPGVIGPGSVRNWLTSVMQAARAGREIVAFNPDAQFNNAVHVADLAKFVCGLLERHWKGAETVTIAAAGGLCIKDVIELIIESFGGRSQVRFEAPSNKSFIVSSSRAKQFFGYDPMQIEEMLYRFAKENLQGD